MFDRPGYVNDKLHLWYCPKILPLLLLASELSQLVSTVIGCENEMFPIGLADLFGHTPEDPLLDNALMSTTKLY